MQHRYPPNPLYQLRILQIIIGLLFILFIYYHGYYLFRIAALHWMRRRIQIWRCRWTRHSSGPLFAMVCNASQSDWSPRMIGMFSTYNRNVPKFESTLLQANVAGTPSRYPVSVLQTPKEGWCSSGSFEEQKNGQIASKISKMLCDIPKKHTWPTLIQKYQSATNPFIPIYLQQKEWVCDSPVWQSYFMLLRDVWMRTHTSYSFVAVLSINS